jgi:hypothetical protein
VPAVINELVPFGWPDGLAGADPVWVSRGHAVLSAIAQSCGGPDNQVACEGSLPGHTNGKIPPMRLKVLAWQALQVVALVIFLIIC